MGELISFPSNGSEASGYLAVPSSGRGPGVLVVQEWWGLVPHIINLCDRFSQEGFVALAPDLFHGQKTTEPDEASKMLMALQLDAAEEDLSGSIDALVARSEGDGVGVVGFCMGGGLALYVASKRNDVVRAVVPFYGAIPLPDASKEYAAIRAAVLGNYATHDDWASPEVVHEIERQIREGGNDDVTMYIYPDTEHAFFNDNRPEVYAPEAAALAWDRTIAFLHDGLDEPA